MSSLAQKVERAIKAHLQAQLAIPGVLGTSGGDVIVTDGGLQIAITSPSGLSTTIDVSFYVGETEETIRLPAVVIVCTEGQEDYPTLNYDCDVVVQVEYNADSTDADDNVVATLEATSNAIAGVISAATLPESISAYEDDFTCQGIKGRSRSRISEGRRRVHRYGLTLYCSEADL